MAVTLTFPSPGYDIFVNIFQSNNFSSYHRDPAIDIGHARIDAMRYNVDAAGAIYNPTSEPLEYEGAVNPAQPDGPPIGHILAFCRDYYLPNRLAAGRKILIIPNAVGGTGYSNANFGSAGPSFPGWGVCGPSKKGQFHERTITRVNTAMASYPGSAIKAFFCQGGEADGFWRATNFPDTGTATTYYEDLEIAGPSGAGVYASFRDYTIAMVADFRARLTGGTSVPFLFGQMAPAYQIPTPLGSTRAIEDVASYLSNSVSIPSAGLTTNNMKLDLTGDWYGVPPFSDIHYDAISQRGGTEWGRTETNPFSKRYWTGYQTLVPS